MTEKELERALEAAERAHQDTAERTLRAWRKVSEGAVKEVTRLKEVLAELANSDDPANDVNNVRSIQKELRHLYELRARAREAGYTSLAVALKAVGQQKKTNLPPLYNVPPLQWVTPARLERVREGLKERVYKVPAVTTKKAQALLKGIRPLLKQLYELWGEDVDYTPVEEAYRTQSYKEFVASLHQVLFEEVAGIEQEEVVVTEPPKPATQLTEEEQMLGALNSLGSGTDYGVGGLE